MPTSLHSKEYKALTKILVDARRQQKVTQQQVALRLRKPQSFVAKYERAERRLDVIEFMDVCRALKVDAAEIIRNLSKS